MNAVWLFLRLPALLRGVWTALVAGMILVILDYFRWSEWQSWTGTLLLFTGLTLAVLDCVYRKQERERMSEFMTALIISLPCAFFAAFVFLLIGLVLFVASSVLHGVDWEAAARGLHFVAIVFVFCFIATVPAVVRKTLEIMARSLPSSVGRGSEGEPLPVPPDPKPE